MAVSADEDRFGTSVRTELRQLEQRFEALAAAAERDACALMEQGHRDDAMALLGQLTANCVEELHQTARRLADEICETVMADGGAYGARKEFLKAYSERVSMPLFADVPEEA